jgi:hypothetical protein
MENKCATKSRSFFRALSVNVVQLCCSLFSQWVKRGQSIRESLSGFRQPGGWNRSVGNWKRVYVVCDRNGSIDLQKTVSEESQRILGGKPL